MNSNLTPLIQRLIRTDAVLARYVMDSKLTDDEQYLIEILLNKEKCSSIDIRLLRALGMEFLCDCNGNFSWQTTN